MDQNVKYLQDFNKQIWLEINKKQRDIENKQNLEREIKFHEIQKKQIKDKQPVKRLYYELSDV